MGFDVSYHPINKEEIYKWYLNPLKDNSLAESVAREYNLDEMHKEQYFQVLNAGRNVDNNDALDITHGYYIAITQGFFSKYYYLRGGAFSFIIEQDSYYRKYTTAWQDIIDNRPPNPIYNLIEQNYTSGVYLSHENVLALLNDYVRDADVKNTLDTFYGGVGIKVFLKALNAAKELNTGLLEATEVIEPQPFDIENISGYTNKYNCDQDGLLYYRDVALKQIADIEKANNKKSGEILNNAEFVRIQVDAPEKREKKSFWKRLFGG